MNKWSEIKQATLNKLSLDEQEARQQGYLEKFRQLANECLDIVANGVKPKIVELVVDVSKDNDGKLTNDFVTLPDDFLSFADMIGFRDDISDPDIIYITDRNIRLPYEGKYRLYYNALWEHITDEDVINDNKLNQHLSVLGLLPTYIASQLLSQDDVQMSYTLKNEFELMLSRLDTNIMYQENHFKSTGGWY